MIGTFGFPVPCLLLAVHAPVYAVAAGALAAGAGSSVSGTLDSTVQQQRVPASMLARIRALELTGAYTLGALGWVVIGPTSKIIGPTSLLGFAAGYAALSSAVVIALPAIRSITWRNPSPAATSATRPASHSGN